MTEPDAGGELLAGTSGQWIAHLAGDAAMNDFDGEFILGAECLIAVLVSLLPTGLAAGCFAWIGRRESGLRGVVPRVAAHAIALCDLLMLVILSIFCVLGIVLGTLRGFPPLTLLGGALLVIVLLQGGALVRLVRWSRMRSLVCWSFGSLQGMFIATVLLALSVGVAVRNISHGGPIVVFGALAVYPLVLSSGPLLMVPAIWMWRRRAREPIAAGRPSQSGPETVGPGDDRMALPFAP